MEKIRVIITTKNAQKTIRRCVESILNQDYPNFEVSLIDGGSTDRTIRISHTYPIEVICGKFTRSEAYNLALKKYQEEVFAIVDADCKVESTWLSELRDALGSEPNIALVGGWFKTADNVGFLEKLIGVEFYARKRRFGKYVTRLNTGNMMFWRRVALEVGGFDESIEANQDTDFSYKVLEADYKIRYVSEADITHYHRSRWSKYFYQQFSYARDLPSVFLNHKRRIQNDTTHPFLMTIQPMLFLFSILLSLFYSITYIPFFVCSTFLLTIWLSEVVEIYKFYSKKNLMMCLALIPLFLVRAVAWVLGGIAYVFRRLIR